MPHTSPSSISKISSSVAIIGAPSTVTSPTSFWMTRIRRPLSRDDAIDQRRLSRTHGPGENGDGDLGRHEGSHDLARAGPSCAIRYARPIADAVWYPWLVSQIAIDVRPRMPAPQRGAGGVGATGMWTFLATDAMGFGGSTHRVWRPSCARRRLAGPAFAPGARARGGDDVRATCLQPDDDAGDPRARRPGAARLAGRDAGCSASRSWRARRSSTHICWAARRRWG